MPEGGYTSIFSILNDLVLITCTGLASSDTGTLSELSLLESFNPLPFPLIAHYDRYKETDVKGNEGSGGGVGIGSGSPSGGSFF